MKTNVKEYDHFRVHTIKKDNYKKCAIEIHCREKINKDNLGKVKALFDLLNRGTKSYPSIKELSKRKEYLYGLVSLCYDSTNGDIIDGVVFAEFLNPKYVDDKNYLNDVIKFVFDYIKEPLLTEKDLKLIKEEQKLSLKHKEEELFSKAFKEAKSTIETSYGLSAFNTEEEIDKLTIEDLKETLKDIINNYTIDIYVIGNLNMNEVEKIIVDNSPFINNKISKLEFDYHVKHRTVKELENKDKFEQSMIIYFYSFENLSREQRLYEATLLSDVLGNGLNSLLYKDIREKHSLCYNLSAVYMRHTNILMITVGVDKKNIAKTKERIEDIMSNLNTLINKDNVSDARLNIISNIEQNTDSIDYLLFESDAVFNNVIDPMDLKLKRFSEITEDSIKAILPNMKEYTKYVLVGDKNENN
jgi:predicted Zn-dependent peptidase